MFGRIFNTFMRYRMFRGMSRGRMAGPSMLFMVGIPLVRRFMNSRKKGMMTSNSMHHDRYNKRAA